MKKTIATLMLTSVFIFAAPAHAQFFGSSIVFDPTNYSQNLLTAARELQQVNNEIQQLQNEATMLQNMSKNLSSLNVTQLSGMVSALTQISTLMNQANGIALNVGATNTAFAQTYPRTYPAITTPSSLTANAQQRWQDSMSAYQTTLQVQAQIAQNVQADTTTLSTLVNASQGAVGNLQAVQAGNQLQALVAKQLLQLQNLMTTQDRAVVLDRARGAQDEAAGQAEFTTFIGTGAAYTPN